MDSVKSVQFLLVWTFINKYNLKLPNLQVGICIVVSAASWQERGVVFEPG